MQVPIVGEMLEAMNQSMEALRARVSDVRVPEPGRMAFEFDGVTRYAPEPMDYLLPTEPTNCKQAKVLAVRALLDGKANAAH